MPIFEKPFSFLEDTSNQTTGKVTLEEPLPYDTTAQGSGFFRPGSLTLDDGGQLELVLYHNDATARFMYLRENGVDAHLLEIAGISADELRGKTRMTLPGQLCLGAERTTLIAEAMNIILQSPVFAPTFASYRQENLAVFPIAREGLKYHVADAINQGYGYYCDEIVLDAHHVFDSSVPVYNRTVELTLFKDKDLDLHQKENIAVAFFADSIASGLVMKEVISRVQERFDRLKQVEVIAPFATIRGLCRLVKSNVLPQCKVRVHVFETLLNALPPDYYFSAHFSDPGFHICPEREEAYRAWWGQDASGAAIADTTCAGYGWSEVFYSPRKQIQMMNGQLQLRHNLTIADILRRHL